MAAELTAKVTLTGDSSGLVTAAAQGSGALDALADSAGNAAAAGGAMAAPYNAATAAIAGQTAASTAAAAALSASGQAKLDEIARLTQLASASSTTTSNITALSSAHAAYNSTVNQARALLAAGVLTQDQYAKAIEAASAQLTLSKVTHDASSAAMMEEMAAAAAVGQGLDGLGEKTARAATHNMAFARGMGEMGREAGLVRVPVRALSEVMEGLGSVASFLGPIGIAAVVAAAGIGLFVSSEMSAQHAQDEINQSLAKGGDLYGLTASQVDSFAQSMANVADVSQRTGQTMAASLAEANIAPTAWNTLTQAATDMAHAYGIAVPEAMKQLTQALGDPGRSAEDFAVKTGMISDAEADLIKHMQDMGNMAGAQTRLADDIAQHFKGAADNTSFWAKAWEDLSKSASDAYTWLSKAGHLGSLGVPGAKGTDPTTGATIVDSTPPGPTAAQQAYQATTNQVVAQAGQLDASLDPYTTKLKELRDEQDKYTEALQRTGLSAKDTATLEKTLGDIHTNIAKTLKEQHDATLNLNDAEKAHEEAVKDYINKTGPQAVINAQNEARALEAQAQASDGTAQSIKALQDQQAITKATENALTLEHYAHGAALQKIKDDIAAVTAAMKAQQQAQEELKAKESVHSEFASATTAYGSTSDAEQGITAGAAAQAQLSAQIRQQDLNDLNNWRTQTLAALANVKEGHDQLAAEVEDIYNDKLAKIYAQDLQRRTDWAAGTERELNELNSQTSNFANTSANLLKGFADQSENAFVSFATGGKNALSNFFTWLEQQLLKLAYQQMLAPTINSMWSDVVGDIGGAFGGTSGLGGFGGGLTSLFSGLFGGAAQTQVAAPIAGGTGLWSAGVFHSGGTIGDGAPAYRMVPPQVFLHAARHHDGTDAIAASAGVSGLQAGEVPTILQTGERVQTADQAAATDAALSRPVVVQMPANQNSAPPVSVNVHNNAPNTQATPTQTTRNADGSFNIDVMVDQIDRTMAQRSQFGKSYLTQSLENTHGLRRSPIG